MGRSSAKQTAAPAAAQVRAYFDSLPPAIRTHLQKLRATIRSTVPAAEEVISYGIPAFKLDGRILVWYAAWKAHSSLYPIGPSLLRAHGDGADQYDSSKGTIRFPLTEPPPVGLIRRLVRARVAELRARSKAR